MLGLKEWIAKVTEHFTPQRGTLTNGVTYVKKGEVVMVTADAHTIIAGSIVQLGTLPFTTLSRVYGVGVAVTNNVYDPNYIRIDTDGKVYGYRRNGTILNATAIAIVGGVLRRSVIATLSAISKIGGGLSVKHKSCLAAYTDLDIRALRWCKLAIYKLWHTDYSNTIKERMACSPLDSAKRSNLRASSEDTDRYRDNSGRHRLDAKWKFNSLLLLCKKRSDIQYCSIPLIDNICETILIDPYGRWWLYA